MTARCWTRLLLVAVVLVPSLASARVSPWRGSRPRLRRMAHAATLLPHRPLPRTARRNHFVTTARGTRVVVDGSGYTNHGGAHGQGGIAVSAARRLQAVRRLARDPRYPKLFAGAVVDAPRGTASVKFMADVTAATGRELALLRMQDGRRVFLLGDSSGVELPAGVKRLIAHSHPSGLLTPSGEGDYLGGKSTVVVGPNGGARRFRLRNQAETFQRWIGNVRATGGDIAAALKNAGALQAGPPSSSSSAPR